MTRSCEAWVYAVCCQKDDMQSHGILCFRTLVTISVELRVAAQCVGPAFGLVSRVAYVCKQDNREADGGAAEALHDTAHAVDKAAAHAHVASQHHLRPHLQLQARLALRPAPLGLEAAISISNKTEMYQGAHALDRNITGAEALVVCHAAQPSSVHSLWHGSWGAHLLEHTILQRMARHVTGAGHVRQRLCETWQACSASVRPVSSAAKRTASPGSSASR